MNKEMAVIRGKLGRYDVEIEIPEGITEDQTFLIKDIFGDLIKYKYHGHFDGIPHISLVEEKI